MAAGPFQLEPSCSILSGPLLLSREGWAGPRSGSAQSSGHWQGPRDPDLAAATSLGQGLQHPRVGPEGSHTTSGNPTVRGEGSAREQPLPKHPARCHGTVPGCADVLWALGTRTLLFNGSQHTCPPHSLHPCCVLPAGRCLHPCVCPAPAATGRQRPAQGLPPESPAHSQAGAHGSPMRPAVTMGRRAACSVPPPGPTTAPWIGHAWPCLPARLCTLPPAALLPAKTGEGSGTVCRQPSATTAAKGPSLCAGSSHFGWKHRV